MDKELLLDAENGIFYHVDQGFAFFLKPVKSGFFQLGDQIPMNSMIDCFWLLKDGTKVGYFFQSQFQFKNMGGYLVSYMNHAQGKATTAELIARTEDLVVYNFPNKGTLVISNKINEELENIFSEQ